MGTNNWPANFRYVSRRLVRQMVDQEVATRTRWRIGSIPTPGGGVGIFRVPVERENDFALIREATKSVSEVTSTLPKTWGDYVRTELDLTLGTVDVFQGWKNQVHVEIAAMKADVVVPDVGRVFVALFGSVSNYVGRKPIPDELGDVPSDVDGLYAILDRTRELGDPEIKYDFLKGDFGHSSLSRIDIAVALLNGPRYGEFRSDRFDILMEPFCISSSTVPYDLVILGAPVWVATPNTF